MTNKSSQNDKDDAKNTLLAMKNAKKDKKIQQEENRAALIVNKDFQTYRYKIPDTIFNKIEHNVYGKHKPSKTMKGSTKDNGYDARFEQFNYIPKIKIQCNLSQNFNDQK